MNIEPLKKTTSLFMLPVSIAGILFLFQAFTPGSTGASTPKIDTTGWPQSFGLGKTATPKQVRAMDISIRPDGKGLPAGSGTVSVGRQIYGQKCLYCHGAKGKVAPILCLLEPWEILPKLKTIGNYWPYATTIFDYVRRAMPFNAPGSLTDNECTV
jgi:cytochrome c